jgi:hypothetical protein
MRAIRCFLCSRRWRPVRGGVVWLALACSASGAAPTLEHWYPVALQAGTTNHLTAIGKFDPWPPQVWVDTPGIVFQAETNAGRFTVWLDPEAPPGPHLVRLFNASGASRPRFVVVSPDRPNDEREPNDDFTRPQPLDSLPATVNGRLDRAGDVDSFAVRLAAGQTLIASLEAYVLGSPFDGVLRLVDARGVQVAFNHDDGRTLDPWLAWTAPAQGTYVLQVFGFAYPARAEVQFTGGAACVYRLHLVNGPYLRYTLPLGVQRGARTRLRLCGWNFPSSGADSGSQVPAAEVEFDGAELAADARWTFFRAPGCENMIALPIGEGPEWLETEPNDTAGAAMPLTWPCAVTGCIERAGDVDAFAFEARQGDALSFALQSAALGFPLDARLRIEDSQGKSLASADDGATADPALDWTAPAHGRFVAVVSSVLHRGGSEHLYRLSVQRARPAVKCVVASHDLTLQAGQTNDLKVRVTRMHGFSAKLTLTATGLPEGVSASAVEVPDNGGEVSLPVAAAAEAAPFGGPIHVVATEAESGVVHPAIAELVGTSIDNGVPNGYHTLVIESTKDIWLTVLPPAAQPSKGE